MRTNSRDASITSLFATRSHHSNLSGKIERFVRFLRRGNVQARASPTIAQLIVRP